MKKLSIIMIPLICFIFILLNVLSAYNDSVSYYAHVKSSLDEHTVKTKENPTDENKLSLANLESIVNYAKTFPALLENMDDSLLANSNPLFNIMRIVVYFLLPFLSVALFVRPWFKNNFLENYLTRQSYASFNRNVFLRSYLLSWCYPLALLIGYILIFGFALKYNPIALKEFLPCILRFGVNFLNLLIMANIALIVVRYFSKFISYALVSFVSFLALEVTIETVFKKATLENLSFATLYITDVNISLFLVKIVILLGTYLILYFLYRNKEKLLSGRIS